MSFFGFDTTLPRDRASQGGNRGIFDTPDPFAEVARAKAQAQLAEDDDV
jgi:DNA topoisomerase 2-associated protein PAT1